MKILSKRSIVLIIILLFVYIYKSNIIYKYYEKKVLENLNLEQNYTYLSSSYLQNSNSFFKKSKKEKKIKIDRNHPWEIEIENYSFNKCLYEKIPKVSGQLETAQYLRYTNTSLVRFGDGEIKLILGRENYGKEKPNKELSKRLTEVFKDDDERIAIGLPNIFTFYPYYKKRSYHSWYIKFVDLVEWMKKNVNYKKQYFDAYITSPYITTYMTSCELVDRVYDNLRAIWEDKDIIWLRGNNGEEYKYDVFDNVRSKKIYYGLANYSWPKYGEYKELLLNEDPDKLYILTLGHLSKLLVQDLTKKGRRALDLGHLPKDYDYYKRKLKPYNFYII